jgi:hypothetical protein
MKAIAINDFATVATVHQLPEPTRERRFRRILWRPK